ncbi:MAG TPA: YtxH domain-containing protein [Terriglobales bacterium]|nr:YtxH domain-containing protein [Terriglobales bacterium]
MADNGNSFGWFLAGLGIGAAIGILYAPRSGEETRQMVRDRAEEQRDRVTRRAREARQQANQWVDRGKDFVQQQKEQLKTAYDAGRQAYKDATATGEGT